MLPRKTRVLAIVAILFLGNLANAGPLTLGDPAPRLDVRSFVKGEPVKELEPGKIYVVEFWATWCGPCREAIPHLSELQKAHPDVTFIGVSVMEQEPEAVKPFVEKMGDQMSYRVALDAVPSGKDPAEGAMVKTWMDAAGQEGIPTAFVVDRSGKIAWIGSPFDLDRPIEGVIAGTWDPKKAAEEMRKQEQERAELIKLNDKLDAAVHSGDPNSVLAVIDEVVKGHPDMELRLGRLKLKMLIQIDEQGQALELANKLEKSERAKDPEFLNLTAWVILSPGPDARASEKLRDLAFRIVTRADQATAGKSGSIKDTLAKAYFEKGMVEKAVETEELAIRLMEENGEPISKGMKGRLARYREAARK